MQNIVDLLGDNMLDIDTIFNSSVLLAWAEANKVNNATVLLQSVLATLVTNADVLLNEALLKTYLNIITPQNVPVFLQTITSTAIQVHTKKANLEQIVLCQGDV